MASSAPYHPPSTHAPPHPRTLSQAHPLLETKLFSVLVSDLLLPSALRHCELSSPTHPSRATLDFRIRFRGSVEYFHRSPLAPLTVSHRILDGINPARGREKLLNFAISTTNQSDLCYPCVSPYGRVYLRVWVRACETKRESIKYLLYSIPL